MKPIQIIIIGFSLILMASMTLVWAQEDIKWVDNTVFVNPIRPPVVFNHDEHNENNDLEDCNVCHHVYRDGQLVEDESSEDQSCAECHLMHDTLETISLRKAYHRNCKGCHLAQKAGPVMCGQCHSKSFQIVSR